MSTLIMIHGAFCGGWVFDAFRQPFEAAGHTVIAPDLPGHAPGDPAQAVIGLSMRDYAAAIAEVVSAQPMPPVLVGHSMGGLVAQMAATRSTVEALVLLAPSPPWGVAGSSLEEAIAAFGVQMINPFAPGVVHPDANVMRQYGLDRMSEADAAHALARLKAESGQALRETLNWWLDPFMTTSLGAGPLTAPSLVLGGDRDCVHPTATLRQVAERIGGHFDILPGMSHWLPAEPGWETVAGRALTWLDETVRAAA
jgi:pimeloyl-ACP methyl ester carboxylesterase